MLKKLRIKFVCINMAIVTVMLCVVLGLVLNFTQINMENQNTQLLQELAGNPMKMGRPGENSAQTRLPHFVLQINPNGDIVAIGGSNYDLSDKQFLSQLIQTAMGSEEEVGLISEYNLRYCRQVTRIGQHIVFADMSGEISTMKNLWQTCIIIGVVGFLAFLGISLLLARWTVKPVEKAWEQQRQFVADASHELKTPLTVITTNAELLQNSECSDEAKQFSENILSMARQMRGLTESLLELARVDNGTVNMTFAEMDFSKMTEQTLLPFEAVFFEKGLRLESQVEAGIRVKGSEAHLRQVVDILLDNAQKYACPGSWAQLELRRHGRGECLLTVANRGEAISPEELKHIFERFYRCDSARSMNQSYGLGLSIAQTVVQAHRGKIWAESTNGVNTFYVQMPVL